MNHIFASFFGFQSKHLPISHQKFDSLTTYGIMKNYSAEDLKTFINTLVAHGFLEVVENIGVRGSFPTIKLNEQSLISNTLP